LLIRFFFFSIGYAGYFLTQPNVPANVLVPFPNSDILIAISRFCVALNIILCVPYNIFMPRVALTSLASVLCCFRPGTAFHILSTTLLVVSAFGLALFVEDIGFVFSIVGALVSTGLAYILPALMYARYMWRLFLTLSLSRYLKLEYPDHPWSKPRYWANIGVLGFGVMVLIMSSYSLIAAKLAS
jgi:amino acid permease